MSDEEQVSEEIVVYGDAPDEDPREVVVTIPVDFVTFYGPLGPTIIHPTDPGGGGGSDLPPEFKENADTLETVFLVAAAGIGILNLYEPVSTLTGITILLALGAEWLDETADDPPQLDYKRPAGSKLPTRSVTLPSRTAHTQLLETSLEVEQASALFLDAIECAQGAFLAADTEWLKRHNNAARDAHLRQVKALQALAEAMPEVTKLLADHEGESVAPPPAWLSQLFASARTILDLTPKDEARIESRLAPVFKRTMPSATDFAAAADKMRRIGDRIANPRMAPVRFAFPRPKG